MQDRKSRPRKAARRDTVTVYVRVPRDLAERLRARASELGWPHSIASVAAEALANGLPKP